MPRKQIERQDRSTRTRGIYRAGTKFEVDKDFRGERIRRRGFDTFEEAESFLISEMERINIHGGRGKQGTLPFQHAAIRYIKAAHEAKKATLQWDVINLQRVLPFIGTLAISKVDDDALQDFIRHMRDEGRERYPVAKPGERSAYKTETINKSLKIVGQILQLCAHKWRDDGGRYLLEKAPDIALLDEFDKREPRPLMWHEQKVFLPLLPLHLRKMALFDLQTGVREHVVCNLRWDWEVYVPEINGSVFVVPKEYVKGEDKYIIDRVIVCNSVAQAIIDGERGKHPEYVFTFTRQKGTKTRIRVGKSRHKVEREAVYQPVKKMNNSGWQTARKKAGMPDLRVHDLRPTVAMRLREAGVAKSTLREILWHANADITDHYSVAMIEEIYGALERIKDESGRVNRTLQSIRQEALAKRAAVKRDGLPQPFPTLKIEYNRVANKGSKEKE